MEKSKIYTRLRPFQPWSYILSLVFQYKQADVSGIVTTERQRVEIAIAWHCPEEG
jgi:hypothetical protein